MKKQNKWTIPIIVAIVCAVAVFLMHPGKAAAAIQEEELDPMTIDYLNPFDLTVRQMVVSQSTSTLTDPVSVQSSVVTTSVSSPSSVMAMAPSEEFEALGSSSAYAQPLKVWIPYRPTFRSPCTPTPW